MKARGRPLAIGGPARPPDARYETERFSSCSSAGDSLRFPKLPRWDESWRKREGIEPTGDVSASRPDLKSGGATSAPSASFHGP